jgi:hypothetical protein
VRPILTYAALLWWKKASQKSINRTSCLCGHNREHAFYSNCSSGGHPDVAYSTVIKILLLYLKEHCVLNVLFDFEVTIFKNVELTNKNIKYRFSNTFINFYEMPLLELALKIQNSKFLAFFFDLYLLKEMF